MTVDKQEFGRLMEAMEDVKGEVSLLREEQKEVWQAINELRGVANKGRGALWVLLSLGTLVGGVLAVLKLTGKGGG